MLYAAFILGIGLRCILITIFTGLEVGFVLFLSPLNVHYQMIDLKS